MTTLLKRFANWLVRVVFGLVLCKTATCLILPFVLRRHREYVPLRPRRDPARDRLAVIISIIPDQSHHFIYRELARLKKLFKLELFSDRRGEEKYRTPLTDDLMEEITFLPPYHSGAHYARYYLSYLKNLLLHPVKVANLLRLFENDLGGKPLGFVDHRSVLDIFHPIYGFYFADLLKKRPVGHIHAYCTHIPTGRALVAAHILEVSFSFTAYVDFDFHYPHKMLEEKVRTSDFVVVHTAFCIERIVGYTSERYRGKIHLVRISLGLDGFAPRPPSGSKRLRLLCMGGLVPKKGHRHLIRACALLKEQGVDFELLVIGDGPLRGRLREEAAAAGLEDRISFLGGVPNEKVMEYFTPDAILVQPSVYAPDGERDGMPTVIAEAMASGTPVISTFVSGIPEAIRNRENGLLVLPEDPKGLAAAIRELASDPALRERFVREGRRTVRELYDASRWIPKLERLLRGSLEKRQMP